MEASVQELMDLEWQLFDDAPLAEQEERERFTVTRSSQLAVWTPELRTSWLRDLQNAQAEGRNLVNEKYIYLLERTDPKRYAAMRAALPSPSLEKLWLVDWICQAQSAWREALAKSGKDGKEVPLMETEGISFETYLRSELMTCSVETLRLYASQIESAQKAGRNLFEDAMEIKPMLAAQ